MQKIYHICGAFDVWEISGNQSGVGEQGGGRNDDGREGEEWAESVSKTERGDEHGAAMNNFEVYD